jgi:hypothetical protein
MKYSLVVNQFYTPGLMDNEYVMKGNAAIMKCSIPSFVSDFVSVTAWIDEDGNEYLASEKYEASKKNKRNLHHIPSPFNLFLKFFQVFKLPYFVTFQVVNQFYDPGIMDKEYVMKGNSAILKCSVPSFVSDFVSVISWVDESGTEYKSSEDSADSKN